MYTSIYKGVDVRSIHQYQCIHQYTKKSKFDVYININVYIHINIIDIQRSPCSMYKPISMYTSIYKEIQVRCIHQYQCIHQHQYHRYTKKSMFDVYMNPLTEDIGLQIIGPRNLSGFPTDLLSGRDSVYSTEKAFNILETPVKTCLICMGTPIKSDVLREWPRPPTEEIRLQIIGSRDLSVFLIDLLCDDRSRDPMCVCVCARACVRERCIFVSRDLSVFPIDLLSPDRSFECR